jgi:hypothetical protein
LPKAKCQQPIGLIRLSGKIMPQLGSNEKPVLMSSKKNKGRLYKPSDGGKGSAPRVNIHSKQYRDNWDLIFNKGGKDANKENES